MAKQKITTELVKFDAPELSKIEKSRAQQIKDTFQPMADMLAEFEAQYTEIIKERDAGVTKELTDKARRLRLDIRKIRTKTGELKDRQKEYIKLEDKAIMGVHNILVWAVREKEDTLEQIEKHFETLERERLEKLQQERVSALLPYVEDASERNLGDMDEDVWTAYYNAKKTAYEDRIKAEKEAELARIKREQEEEAERQRIREENIRLQREAEEREKREAAEKKRIEAEREKERKAAEKKLAAEAEARRKEREAMERKLEAERKKHEKELAEAEAAKKKEIEAAEKKLEEERAAAERIRKAEEDRIRKEKEDREAELKKGDAEKIKDLIKDLEQLKSKYTFKAERNIRVYKGVSTLIDKVVTYIKEAK